MTKLTEARDIIAGILSHRRGLVLTDAVIRDAANNAATALIPLLDDRYSVVRGEVETPPAPKVHAFMNRKEPLCEHDYTMFGEHERVVSTDSPEVNCSTCLSIRGARETRDPITGETNEELARRLIK